MIKNIMTVCISTFASVLFFNFLLMTYNVFYFERLTPEHRLRLAVTDAGLEWDPRKAGEVLVDLRKAGVDAVPNFTPIRTADYFGEFDYLPLGGRSHATVILCNEVGQWLTYQSDRFGFNNHDSIHDNPRVKMALIGDSYVQGYCVPREHTIGGQLNKNGFHTINLGMSGNGFVSYVATFMEYVRPLKIKTTILVWFYNDLDDTQREYQHANLKYYVDNTNTKLLKMKQNQIDARLDQLITLNPYQSEETSQESVRFKEENINWQAYIRGLVTLSGIRSSLQSALGTRFRFTRKAEWNEQSSASFSIMKKSLRKIADTAESWGGQVIVVTLPPYGGNTPQFAMQISAMRKTFKGKKNIMISDFEPIYKKYGKERLYALSLNGTHFNEYGYCLFAKHVAGLISRLGKQETSSQSFSDCQTEFRVAFK
ncbi:hypothetical protein [Candidatus Nitrospira salsa]